MSRKKTASQDEAHSKIGASSMHRWGNCPGSVRLSQGIEQVTSPYAMEGTEAHALAEAILARELFGKKVKRPHADPEMQAAVHVYTEFVLNEAKNASEVLIEHKFDLSDLHPGLFGTADCVIYNAENKKLTVVDYKHGAGISVSPRNNEQLMYYGLGALLSTGYPCEIIELVIVQPRCPHPDGLVRRYAMLAYELLEFSAALKEKAVATENPNAAIIAGNHCRFCPAAPICPELTKQANLVATSEFSPLVMADKPEGTELNYDPDKLSETLYKLDMIEDWAKSVRAFAYAEATKGRCPPGWKLVDKVPRRKWVNEAQVMEALTVCGFSCLDYMTDPELKSPAQIEKLLSENQLSTELLNPLVTKVSSGTTLVPDTDRRESVTRDASKDFTKLEDPQ